MLRRVHATIACALWHARCTMFVMKSSDVLLKLICACVDDERTLKHELKFVDAGRAGTLEGLARERQSFVANLEPLVGPGKFQWDGSWAELLREAGRNAEVAAAGRNSPEAGRNLEVVAPLKYVDGRHDRTDRPPADTRLM